MAVLKAVVSEYVTTCSPVGSKTIVSNHGLGVSSATIRNDLSKLEETGHLTQPHVSAGRIPTDLGYRAYVDHAIDTGSIFTPTMNISATSASDAMTQIAKSLASMTQCLAIVSDPVAQSVAAARINLVPVTQDSLVVVLVLDDGSVESKQIRCSGLSQVELKCVEQYLNDLFVGKDVASIKESHIFDEGRLDAFTSKLAGLVKSSVYKQSDASKVSTGVSLLLAQPEFQDVDSVRVFVGALEDDAISLDCANMSSEDGLVVSIGSENEDERLSSFSFIAKEFMVDNKQGFVGCVGPTRMDYKKIIGSVTAASHTAKQVFREFEL